MYTIIRKTKDISDVIATIADDATNLTLTKIAKTANFGGEQLNYAALAVNEMHDEVVYYGRTLRYVGLGCNLTCQAALEHTTDALNRLLAVASDAPWTRDNKLAYMRGLTDYADVWRQLVGDMAKGNSTTYVCKAVVSK